MQPTLGTWLRTIRYLRPIQIFGRLWIRLHKARIDESLPPIRRSVVGRWSIPIQRVPSQLGPSLFRFLNEDHEVGEGAAWDDPTVAKLWRYNLHYFDDLNAVESDTRLFWHKNVLQRWVCENLPGQGTGWEPYPVSLRIVNWIKWSLAGNVLTETLLHSLAVQVRWLLGCLEIHLLGNHLFANAKALVFAGFFFSGREAENWLHKGLSLVQRELSEQILEDGGQFERAPMYHALALEDVLDLINIFQIFGRKVPSGWLDLQKHMFVWLEGLTHPDGEIALFNDSAFGIAPSLRDLAEYSCCLGLEQLNCVESSLLHFPVTGYIRCSKGIALLLVDVAPIGPDYLPGHAHADTGTFEFSLYGQRVIVDTGTSTYEKNEERQRQRGTAAHNTVCIDNCDSSEVWGGFRVGRRAYPFGVECSQSEDFINIVCSHDGYKFLHGSPVHRRYWRLGKQELRVRDLIIGLFGRAFARYHFHPDISLVVYDASHIKGVLPDGCAFHCHIVNGIARLVDSTWHPSFNISVPIKCIEITFVDSEIEIYFTWK